jgi:hypothetical protein
VLVPRVILFTLFSAVQFHVAQVPQFVAVRGLAIRPRVGAAGSAVKPPAEVIPGFGWTLPSLLLGFLPLGWQSRAWLLAEPGGPNVC